MNTHRKVVKGVKRAARRTDKEIVKEELEAAELLHPSVEESLAMVTSRITFKLAGKPVLALICEKRVNAQYAAVVRAVVYDEENWTNALLWERCIQPWAEAALGRKLKTPGEWVIAGGLP